MTSLPFEDLPATTFDMFEHDFWPLWPLKVGKKDARKAFNKALSRASVGKILEGIPRYKAFKPAWQSWMHPATYLNGDHWEDVYDTIPALKAGIIGGAFRGESLQTIAEIARKPWGRCRYPRDVLEQCVAEGLITVEQMEAAL